MGNKTRAQIINDSQKKIYDRLEIYVRKEFKIKERIEQHCLEYGYVNEESISGKKTNRVAFITKAIETQMAIDRGELKLTKPRKKKEEK